MLDTLPITPQVLPKILTPPRRALIPTPRMLTTLRILPMRTVLPTPRTLTTLFTQRMRTAIQQRDHTTVNQLEQRVPYILLMPTIRQLQVPTATLPVHTQFKFQPAQVNLCPAQPDIAPLQSSLLP